MFEIWSHSSRSWACVRLHIYSCFLSKTIETYWRDALRIAFESPRKCVWVTSELFWVTSELPLNHLARNCVWDNSELRLSHLGITFESPRNYVWMTSIAKLVASTWPLVTYRVPPVNCLITEVIPHGPAHERVCVWIYNPVFHDRLSKLTEEMPSELHLNHLGNAFESPRKCVWVTSDAELIAITWPLETYRVFPVNCFIADFIPRGPEHACVWKYVPVLHEKLSKLTEEMPSELHLSHRGNAFKSPRNCIWVTWKLSLIHLARNCVRDNSELRLSHLGTTFESPRNYVWMTLIAKLVAITWPLVTYRVFPGNCLITEVVPHDPQHACVWIYIPVFYHRLSKLTEDIPLE